MSARTRPRKTFTVSALIVAAALAWPPARSALAQTSAEPETTVIDGAAEQHELALRLFPSLLEMGLDVIPSDDQARSVLAAVNALRRQDNQRPVAALDADAVAYVEGKVAAYRTQRLLTIRVQGALDALGFDPGPIDGLYGPLTTEAVKRYQRSVGLPAIGVLSAEQVDALEMRSIDKIMRVPVAPAADDSKSMVGAPAGGDKAIVAAPNLEPSIDPDLLDFVGR